MAIGNLRPDNADRCELSQPVGEVSDRHGRLACYKGDTDPLVAPTGRTLERPLKRWALSFCRSDPPFCVCADPGLLRPSRPAEKRPSPGKPWTLRQGVVHAWAQSSAVGLIRNAPGAVILKRSRWNFRCSKRIPYGVFCQFPVLHDPATTPGNCIEQWRQRVHRSTLLQQQNRADCPQAPYPAGHRRNSARRRRTGQSSPRRMKLAVSRKSFALGLRLISPVLSSF